MKLKVELEVTLAPEGESGCDYCMFFDGCPGILVPVCNINDRAYFTIDQEETK